MTISLDGDCVMCYTINTVKDKDKNTERKALLFLKQRLPKVCCISKIFIFSLLDHQKCLSKNSRKTDLKLKFKERGNAK